MKTSIAKSPELPETTIAKCWQCDRPAITTCTHKGEKTHVCKPCVNNWINKVFGVKNKMDINLKKVS